MYFIENKYARKIKIFLFVIMVLFLLGNFDKNIIKNKKIDIINSKYIISLSMARSSSSKLLFLNDNGEQIDTYNYRGYSINSVNYFDNKLFLTSSRKNEHYILDTKGIIEKYSNVVSNKKNSEYNASWFTNVGENTLIETVNLGAGDNKYLSGIIYSYDGNKKECILENEYLRNAIDKYDKIFVSSYNQYDKRYGITVINKRTSKIEKKINFKNRFTSSRGDLIDYNNKLITYGNNKGTLYMDNTYLSSIGIFDYNTYETIEYLFDKDSLNFAYVYKNNIYAITNNNNIYKFDENLNLIEKISIKDKTFFDYFRQGNYSVRKIIPSDKTISVLYTSKDFDPENIGFIIEYNPKNMDMLNKFNIILKGESKWFAEVVDFIKLY